MNQTSLTIVAMGDSITALPAPEDGLLWTALVERELQWRFPDAAVTVVNAGVGGQTSREGLHAMDERVLPHAPDILLVELGGNDATRDEARAVTVDEFARNLAAIRAKLAASGGGDMVVLPFSPVVDEKHAWGHFEKYTEAGGLDNYILPYRETARAFAREHDLPIADIDAALRTDLPAHILDDGVHLTSQGVQTVAACVLAVLVDVVGAKVQP